MVKSNPNSRFVLYTLSQIRDCKDVILQIEKTDSQFTETKESCYLCEVVSNINYSRATVDDLVRENIRVNDENRKLRVKIEKLLRKVG